LLQCVSDVCVGYDHKFTTPKSWKISKIIEESFCNFHGTTALDLCCTEHHYTTPPPGGVDNLEPPANAGGADKSAQGSDYNKPAKSR
jgi:hypothetical protein